jgi:hypothetical protein
VSFDFNAHYRVDGYDGVAWYALKHPAVREPIDCELAGSFEEFPNVNRVVLVMVGDDRKFEFDVDEVHKITETDFCRECGQIGCGCSVYQ